MNAWELVHTSPIPLAYHAGVIYDNRAISIGGVSNGNYVPWVVQTQEGTILQTLSTPTGMTSRARAAACVFNNRIFVSGGFAGGACFKDILSSQNLRKWEDSLTDDIPAEGLMNHRHVAFGNTRVKLVSLGGYNGSEFLNNIYQSVDGRVWEEVAVQGSQWSDRSGFGAVVYKNKLWIYGGCDALNDYNDVWWTDDLIHWHRALEHAPWSVRSDFGFCEWDERIWVMAGKHYSGRGQGGATTGDRDVWFSRDGSTWEQAFDFPSDCSHTFMGVIDNMIHVFGGVGNEQNIYRMRLG
jgi:N-acetylneuraminic acid mutarotase